MPMSDKEQVQLVKSWWKEYGYYILFSVLFFLVANFGWRYWQQYRRVSSEQASVIYAQMLTASEQQKNVEAKLFGERLIKNYARSPYASLAALILAKDEVKSGDLKLAEERLQFVIKKSPSKAIRQIARIRAARVLIAMKNPRGALDLLAPVDDSSYTAQISETYGDALMVLGEVKEAEKAYRKSQSMTKDKLESPLLKMKLRQF